jgi:hypothetical integral membrane protein (TIGR02206 family)
VHCFFLFKFQAYGVEHFTWLAFGALCLWLWIRLGRSQQHERDQQRIGLIFSLLPALLWIAVALQLALFERPVDLNLVLPFHVCYILNLLMPVMLWRRSYFLFEVSYFIILAGCIQALLTPDLQTVFPEKINIRYFVVHMGLVQSILYAVLVYRFRPTWRSLFKSLLWGNIYFVFVLGINALLGTNFMFLRHKPPSPSLLDLFGEWPWYILGAEGLALVLYVLVLLPFVAFRQRKKHE